MLSVPPNKTAVRILQQALMKSRPQDDGVSVAERVLRTANGKDADATPVQGLLQAQGRITEALFNPVVPDATTMKIRLMERLGEELGISMDDFDSRFAYGVALKSILEGIKRLSDSPAIIKEIEKNLGLDELGISLDTLISAVTEPGGDDEQQLDAALKDKVGETDNEAKAALEALQKVKPDENGLYSSG